LAALPGMRDLPVSCVNLEILGIQSQNTALMPHQLPDRHLASHQAKTKNELKHLARRKLQSMAKRPALMRGIFFRCCIAELFNE
jgi:hypothetical protein